MPYLPPPSSSIPLGDGYYSTGTLQEDPPGSSYYPAEQFTWPSFNGREWRPSAASFESNDGLTISSNGAGSSAFDSGMIDTLLPGVEYTIIASVSLAVAQTGTLPPNARTVEVLWSDEVAPQPVTGNYYAPSSENLAQGDGYYSTGNAQPLSEGYYTVGPELAQLAVSNQAPNQAGEHELRLTFTVPADAQSIALRLNNGAGAGGGDLTFTSLFITEGAYDGQAFDGDTPSTERDSYFWTGEPGFSESQESVYSVTSIKKHDGNVSGWSVSENATAVGPGSPNAATGTASVTVSANDESDTLVQDEATFNHELFGSTSGRISAAAIGNIDATVTIDNDLSRLNVQRTFRLREEFGPTEQEQDIYREFSSWDLAQRPEFAGFVFDAWVNTDEGVFWSDIEARVGLMGHHADGRSIVAILSRWGATLSYRVFGPELGALIGASWNGRQSGGKNFTLGDDAVQTINLVFANADGSGTLMRFAGMTQQGVYGFGTTENYGVAELSTAALGLPVNLRARPRRNLLSQEIPTINQVRSGISGFWDYRAVLANVGVGNFIKLWEGVVNQNDHTIAFDGAASTLGAVSTTGDLSFVATRNTSIVGSTVAATISIADGSMNGWRNINWATGAQNYADNNPTFTLYPIVDVANSGGATGAYVKITLGISAQSTGAGYIYAYQITNASLIVTRLVDKVGLSTRFDSTSFNDPQSAILAGDVRRVARPVTLDYRLGELVERTVALVRPYRGVDWDSSIRRIYNEFGATDYVYEMYVSGFVPEWSDSVWTKLNQLCHAENINASSYRGALYMSGNERPIQNLPGNAVVTGTAVSPASARNVLLGWTNAEDAIASQHTGGSGGSAIQPPDVLYDASTDGDRTFAVEAGRTETFTVQTTNYPTYIRPPFRASTLAQWQGSDVYNGGYYLIASDGLPVAANQFEAYGGSLTIQRNPTIPGAVDIVFKGPDVAIPGVPAPYTIGISDGSTTRGALKVMFSGVKTKPTTEPVNTGADETAVVNELDESPANNPFIVTREHAYTRGTWAIGKAGAPKKSVSLLIPWFDSNGFGLTSGSLFRFQDSNYRVESVQFSGIGATITALQYTKVQDFVNEWGEDATVQDLVDLWGGRKVKDLAIRPLKTG